MNSPDFMVLDLSHTMTDDEIKHAMQQMRPVVLEYKQGFLVSIQGFDNDPRELWEIPQVISFMKRICEFGFISWLEVSTTCPAFFSRDDGQKLPGLGALEIWLFANGKMKRGKYELDEFLKFLDISNSRAEKVSKESPYKTKFCIANLFMGKFKKTSMPDAPQKHGHHWN